MKLLIHVSSLLVLMFISCSEKQVENNYYQQTSGLPFIEGQPEYLASAFVTAGNRVYMVGHQDGTFPDLGWHIEGEMGGIWNHPIKLMDGFTANITVNGSQNSFCLDKAEKFINYPIGNSHHFFWEKENLSIDRFQFVPDGVEGMIIEFRIVNKANEEKEIDFGFTGMTDLRPTWLGERTNMIDSEDEIVFDENISAVIGKDKSNPWYTAFGSQVKPSGYSDQPTACGVKRKGLGKNGTLSFAFTLEPREEKVIPFFIAGSYQSEALLKLTLESLKREGVSQLIQKKDRYKEINANSQLTIPDKGLQQMYEWLKYNTEWLVRHVPEQGVAVSAGLPDYPWWFGADMTYTVQGLLATGNHALAKSSITLLRNMSRKANNNGRIIHEVSTNGAVYNPGNVNETAQFISLIQNYYAWTGDRELVTRFYPDINNGIKWLLEEMDPDGNGYPNGNGMMEIPGLDSEMIDVAVYTQQALAGASELARAMGDPQRSADYEKRAETLKSKINTEWWNLQEQSFGDFRGTVAEAKPILEAALVRADTLKKPWAVDELKEIQKKFRNHQTGEQSPHVVYHNWVVNTPLETGVADMEKGKRALQTALKYENPFGVFVTGIDRTEEPDSVVLKSRKKTFSYTGAVMTLPTGVQAVAAARYGTPGDALAYLKKLQMSFSYALPGSMYEVSPDFGMVTQAWNIYGVAVPVVSHFFGICPRAYERTVHLSPRMPLEWNEATLENVKVGDNSLSLTIKQKGDHKEYRIGQTQTNWTVSLEIVNAKNVMLNDKKVDLTSVGDTLLLKGKENILQVY